MCASARLLRFRWDAASFVSLARRLSWRASGLASNFMSQTAKTTARSLEFHTSPVRLAMAFSFAPVKSKPPLALRTIDRLRLRSVQLWDIRGHPVCEPTLYVPRQYLCPLPAQQARPSPLPRPPCQQHPPRNHAYCSPCRPGNRFNPRHHQRTTPSLRADQMAQSPHPVALVSLPL